jgi:hypothetical protein
MSRKIAVAIIIGAFLVGVLAGNWLFMLAHESSHALVLTVVNVPYSFSITKTLPLAAIPSNAQTAFYLAGGIGEAILAALLFFVASRFEKRSGRILLAAVGLEMAFLYFVFLGIGNALWEGLATESYVNQTTRAGQLALVALTMTPAIVIMIKLKMAKIKSAISS